MKYKHRRFWSFFLFAAVALVVAGLRLYGELYAYRISDGTMIRLTDNKWEEGMASWEAPLAGK